MHLRRSDKFLIILLVIDSIFILLSFIDSFSDFRLKNFAVQNDNLYAEQFQYIKFIGISILSCLVAIKKRSLQFISFMIIPLYLYLDDSRQLHEKFGTKIASFIYEYSHNDKLIRNFRYQDIGEILYMSLVAFILLIVFLICFKFSGFIERYFLKHLLKLFLSFGFFAIFIDSIHQLSYGFTYKLLSIIEDGGEMFPISFITAYFFEYLLNNKKKIT